MDSTEPLTLLLRSNYILQELTIGELESCHSMGIHVWDRKSLLGEYKISFKECTSATFHTEVSWSFAWLVIRECLQNGIVE